VNVALSPRVMRPALIAIATAMLLLPALTPAPAGATASGPCSALGYESRLPASPAQMLAAGKEGRKDVTLTDLGFSSVWQVHPDSTLLVSGTAPITMHAANASVTLFGVPVPVYEATGASATGYVGDIEMRQLAPFLRTLGLEARAGPCSGAVVLAVQENPLLTVAGGGGVLLGFIGIVGLVRVALRRRRPGVARRVGALALGILFGGMAGLGEGSGCSRPERSRRWTRARSRCPRPASCSVCWRACWAASAGGRRPRRPRLPRRSLATGCWA
jgi:hypothetical protein